MGIKPIRQPFIRLINGDFGKSKEQNQKNHRKMLQNDRKEEFLRMTYHGKYDMMDTEIKIRTIR